MDSSIKIIVHYSNPEKGKAFHNPYNIANIHLYNSMKTDKEIIKERPEYIKKRSEPLQKHKEYYWIDYSYPLLFILGFLTLIHCLSKKPNRNKWPFVYDGWIPTQSQSKGCWFGCVKSKKS